MNNKLHPIYNIINKYLPQIYNKLKLFVLTSKHHPTLHFMGVTRTSHMFQRARKPTNRKVICNIHQVL